MVICMFSGNQATPENPAAAPRTSGRLSHPHAPHKDGAGRRQLCRVPLLTAREAELRGGRRDQARLSAELRPASETPRVLPTETSPVLGSQPLNGVSVRF